MIVVDGAQSRRSACAADALADWRRAHPGGHVTLIVGMMRDKHPKEFLAPLLPLTDTLILTQADLPRASTGAELRALLAEIAPRALGGADAGGMRWRWPNVPRPQSDLICVTGSLMLVGEIKALSEGVPSPVRG